MRTLGFLTAKGNAVEPLHPGMLEHGLVLATVQVLEDAYTHERETHPTVSLSLLCFSLECPGNHRNSLAVLLQWLAETHHSQQLTRSAVAVTDDHSVCLLAACSEKRAVEFARMVRTRIQKLDISRRDDLPRFSVGIVPGRDENSTSRSAVRLALRTCREAGRKGNNRIDVYQGTLPRTSR